MSKKGPANQLSNIQRIVNAYKKQFDELTNRDVEVLQLIASGMDISAVAKELNITRRAVKNHQINIRKRLPVKNQADYIKFALAFGLISF